MAGMVVVWSATAALAQGADIAICGASDGYAFYPTVPVTGDEDVGWIADRIPTGKMTLTMVGDTEADLLYTDATGRVSSATQEGGHVVLIGSLPDAISVLVVYPGLAETYSFRLSSDGPEVLWTTNKYGTLIPKAGAYRAPCSYFILAKKQ